MMKNLKAFSYRLVVLASFLLVLPAPFRWN